MAIKPKPKPNQAATAGVGLNPTDETLWTAGGGLFDDFDGKIMEMAFAQFDYQGTQGPVFALAAEILNEEIEQEDGKNPFIQYYSAGDLADWAPSDDGKEAVPVGTKTGLSKGTNAFAFLMSMIKAGFPADQVGQRVDVFEGARFHFKRAALLDSKGKPRLNQQKKVTEILEAEKLLSMPGEEGTAGAGAAKPGPKAGPGPKPAPKGPAAPPTKPAQPASTKPGPKAVPTTTTSPSETETVADHGVDDETMTWTAAYIIEKIEGNGGSHPKLGLAKDVVKWAKEQDLENTVRNKVIQALGNEAFLSTEGLGWTFDGETLTQE